MKARMMGIGVMAALATVVANAGPGAGALPGKTGFTVIEEEGRYWIFKDGSKDLEKFKKHGELAKHVVRPNAGPGGVTLKSPDAETLTAYLCGRPGFVVKMEDGRLWIFHPGSKELDQFEKNGELAKHVVRPGAGPMGMTLKAQSAEILDEYLAARPGFVAHKKGDILWIFREDAPELDHFKRNGSLSNPVSREGAGPGGVTIKAKGADVIDDYLKAGSN